MRKIPDDTEPMALVRRCASDILLSEGMRRERGLLQHGGVSCYDHSVRVACLSVELARRLRVSVDLESMIRGALLHDYFLYDWHEKSGAHRLHGFTHPGCALRNAERDFFLTDVSRDVILRHRFPLTPLPPACPESALVTLADKLCAAEETLGRLPLSLLAARR